MKKIKLLLKCMPYIFLFLCGCGTDYSEEMTGKFITSENGNMRENLELELSTNGRFVYKNDKVLILTGTWQAKELREMASIVFKIKSTSSWTKTEGSFNAPECDEIKIWHPMFFGFHKNDTIIFIKKK